MNASLFLGHTVPAGGEGVGAAGCYNTNGRMGSAYTTRSDSIDNDNATTASVPPAISVVTFRWDSISKHSGAPDRYREAIYILLLGQIYSNHLEYS